MQLFLEPNYKLNLPCPFNLLQTAVDNHLMTTAHVQVLDAMYFKQQTTQMSTVASQSITNVASHQLESFLL